MNKTHQWLLASLVLPFTLASTQVMAESRADVHRHHKNMKQVSTPFHGLELSAEQKTQLREWHQQNSDKMRSDRAANQAERKALYDRQQALLLAPEFDRVQATELARAMLEQQLEHKVNHMEREHKLWSVLTDEQKAQWQKNQHQGHKMRPAHQHKMKVTPESSDL